jgi:hypothetical protein
MPSVLPETASAARRPLISLRAPPEIRPFLERGIVVLLRKKERKGKERKGKERKEEKKRRKESNNSKKTHKQTLYVCGNQFFPKGCICHHIDG